MEVRDYNGTGIWTWDVVVNRYNDYARRLGILNIRDLKPKMFAEGDENGSLECCWQAMFRTNLKNMRNCSDGLGRSMVAGD
jgi:hypothetical protein